MGFFFCIFNQTENVFFDTACVCKDSSNIGKFCSDISLLNKELLNQSDLHIRQVQKQVNLITSPTEIDFDNSVYPGQLMILYIFIDIVLFHCNL